MIHRIGAPPREQRGTFVREDIHSIKVGVVVSYLVVGTDFMIVAHREGVDMRGTFPTVNRVGINALIDMLNRAVRHHEHLKSFAVGEKQTTIPEILFEEEEAQRDARIAIVPEDIKPVM